MKLNTFLHFSMNKFSFVELYAKCVKEGHIEWTRPEKAIETTKNAWQKAKLRLVMLSAGAIIEITCSKVKYYDIFFYIRLYVHTIFICTKQYLIHFKNTSHSNIDNKMISHQLHFFYYF